MDEKSWVMKKWIAASVILFLLLFFIVFLIINVNDLQGNGRVVNYIGIVRGATQRLVKLELSGRENDELIVYIDKILWGLQYGGGEYKSLTN